MAKPAKPRARLSPQARQDITDILLWTHEHFGASAAERYEDLLIQALRDLEADPARPGTKSRVDLMPGVHSYHLLSSRGLPDAPSVKKPRHFILYRKPPDGGLDILRILHDSRDLARHLPPPPP